MPASRVAELLFVAALAGCGGAAPDTLEAHAARVVWQAVYAAPGEPPAVEWRRDTCPAHPDGQPAVLWGTVCYAGLYIPNDRVYCAVRATPSASALAHELMHARQWIVSTVEDPDHLRADDWQLARDADAQLRALGM